MKIVVRFTKPTAFDELPYGTIINIPEIPGERAQYYIQTSKEEYKPRWISSGDLFNSVFMELIDKDGFMDNCLELYNGNNNKKENLSIIAGMLFGLE
jgi:hypothetical protein